MPFTARPRFRLICAACEKPIALNADVSVVDAEWVRRYPRSMRGRIVCASCAFLDGPCMVSDGIYMAGHIHVRDPGDRYVKRRDFDLWNHVLHQATQRAAVLDYPASGIAQGAREYLQAVAVERGVTPQLREAITEALDRA